MFEYDELENVNELEESGISAEEEDEHQNGILYNDVPLETQHNYFGNNDSKKYEEIRCTSLT